MANKNTISPPLTRLACLTLLSLSLGAAACGPDSRFEPKRFDLPTTQRSSTYDGDGDGWSDALERAVGMDPEAQDAPCVSASYTQSAQVERTPAIDFILIIDNSASMIEEFALIAQDLRDVFYPALAASDVDSRVLVMTRAALPADALCPNNSACAGSGFDPAQGALLLGVDVQSTDGLTKLLKHADQGDGSTSMPGGWSQWLRPDAQKVFIMMSDDDSTLSQQRFEEELKARWSSYFYDAQGQRRFVWHSVVGAALEGERYLGPDEAIVERGCSSAPRAGLVYQRLSTLTRGLRFSICAQVPYAEVFDRIVSQAGAQSRIPCTLTLPRPKQSDLMLATNKVAIQLDSPRAEEPTVYTQVSDLSQCHDQGFVLEAVSDRWRVKLCEQACAAVAAQEDLVARVVAQCQNTSCSGSLTFGCD